MPMNAQSCWTLTTVNWVKFFSVTPTRFKKTLNDGNFGSRVPSHNLVLATSGQLHRTPSIEWPAFSQDISSGAIC
jgi:hypothetical protein